jgi:LmbE family N-acetylglucosaminyl deacetylase
MRTTLLPQQLGTILSVWAHPDDETYLAGGLMAAAAAHGQRVVCVCATAGEHGTDDPTAWPPERLGPVRRWEAAAAMAVLGVAEHHWLDLPDGGLAGLDPTGPVDRLAALIAQVWPDTILTFGPHGSTGHPDHCTVSRWVGAAHRRVGTGARLLHAATTEPHVAEWGPLYEEWGVYMTDERPPPVPVADLAVDLRLAGDLLDRKVTALRAMATQTSGALALLGEDAYRRMNAEEAFVAA